MTGYFPGENTFGLFPSILSPDGQWLFDFSLTVEEQLNWSWECGNGVCTRYGGGPVTGGTAVGNLYQWNGGNPLPYATFTGWVTGGGVEKVELWVSGYMTAYNYQYHYGFVGVWSNQWHTSGSVYGWNTWSGYGEPGPGGSWFDITTQTPEPGTIIMLGSGLLMFAKTLLKKTTGA